MNTRKLMVPATLAALALVLAACGGKTASRSTPDWSNPQTIQYADSLHVDLSSMTRTEDGLYYKDIKEGSGEEAEPGDVAVVHYTGYLPNGKVFDANGPSDPPFTFEMGIGRVIRGWDIGVQGMKVGGERLLVIPPDLAYGSKGAGDAVPPNTTLIFDITLTDVR
ncbi:MAG TPA: FKBP-type peptidyl-prolyl cis-trans isomerase [Longimicrobiales bacterium]|nr:FKBP-type peptidyl-prolyl cis-trans isomerase [Longimicrobiales bacterium]